MGIQADATGPRNSATNRAADAPRAARGDPNATDAPPARKPQKDSGVVSSQYVVAGVKDQGG